MAMRWSGIFVLMGLAATGVKAVDLGTVAGCNATDAQFSGSVLWTGPAPVSAQDPGGNTILRMSFVKQADASVDVYFVQKRGPVNRYNGKTKTTDVLGSINADFSQNEYGLLGIATKKDFLTNPYVYLYYSFKESDNSLTCRLTRIKMTSDMTKLDMATEKVLIKFVRESVTWHTGGDMSFDDYGDLWVTIGDNQQTDKGPANTADLRGSILRIHPDESVAGYSIPVGNFGAYWQNYFTTKGNTALAAKYADTNVVKPQIYVKGTRNAYSMYVDPVRRWVTWGDVGPDQQKSSEEYNLVQAPVYAGWPYYAGQEDMGTIQIYGNTTAIKTGETKAAPTNQAGLGAVTLPPVTDPIYDKIEDCAMSGPIFRYDGANTNAGQFPPQMNRKWLLGDCSGSYGWHLITLNDSGTQIVTNTKIWATLTPKITTLVDAKQGPDGSMYVADYGKGTLNKYDYTGTCKDPTLALEQIPPSVVGKLPSRAAWLAFDSHSISISAQGEHHIDILNLQGRVVASLEGSGPESHALPKLPAAGIYHLHVRTAAGEVFAALPYIGR